MPVGYTEVSDEVKKKRYDDALPDFFLSLFDGGR